MIENAAGTEDLAKEFLQIPHLVYAGDPMWIPESQAALERAFSEANPWFERGLAHTWWIPGQARVAAFLDPKVEVNGRAAAFFGFWETLGDPRTDEALMAEVEAWARSQGAMDLYGPMNFNIFGTYRLRTSAEPGAVTFPGEAYHPVYYQRILEGLGFSTKHRYTTWIVDLRDSKALLEELRPTRDQLAAKGYWIGNLDPTWWVEHLREVYQCANAILGEYFAYAPVSYEVFAEECGHSFIRKACPHSSIVAHAPNGRLIGFLILYPNYGPLIVSGAGTSRVDVTELDYDTHMPLLQAKVGLPDSVAYFMGVHPEHRGFGGLFAAMAAEAADRAMHRCNRLLGAMSRVSTPPPLFSRGHDTPQRLYALYHKTLEP